MQTVAVRSFGHGAFQPELAGWCATTVVPTMLAVSIVHTFVERVASLGDASGY